MMLSSARMHRNPKTSNHVVSWNMPVGMGATGEYQNVAVAGDPCHWLCSCMNWKRKVFTQALHSGFKTFQKSYRSLGQKDLLHVKNHISLLTRRFHVYLWRRCCLHLHWHGRWCLQRLWFWKPSLASVRGPKHSHQYLYDPPLFHGSCLWPPT